MKISRMILQKNFWNSKNSNFLELRKKSLTKRLRKLLKMKRKRKTTLPNNSMMIIWRFQNWRRKWMKLRLRQNSTYSTWSVLLKVHSRVKIVSLKRLSQKWKHKLKLLKGNLRPRILSQQLLRSIFKLSRLKFKSWFKNVNKRKTRKELILNQKSRKSKVNVKTQLSSTRRLKN